MNPAYCISEKWFSGNALLTIIALIKLLWANERIIKKQHTEIGIVDCIGFLVTDLMHNKSVVNCFFYRSED